MGLFKKKEVEKKKYIFQDSKIYFEYQMPLWEKIAMFLLGFVVGILVGYVFYAIWAVAIVFGVIAGICLIPVSGKYHISKQTNTLKKQFKALLESISTSIGAGQNMFDAFSGAYKDMKELFSPEAYIVKETENILGGLHSNVNIEVLLRDLAERSGIEDIQTFADVFDTCYRKGGDMKEVIGSTYKILNDKMEIDMEIQTMIAASKSELNMMCCMPVVFVFILNSMGSELTGRGTTAGYIATTIALVIFVAAYFLGRKIMAIKL